MENSPEFTVGVLLYGDHPELAARCLASLGPFVDRQAPIALRIGLNEAGEPTRRIVHNFFDRVVSSGSKPLIYDSKVNRGKYPLMRWMFHDVYLPLLTPYTMWFDDDSFIRNPGQLDWFDCVKRMLQHYDVCGAAMSVGITFAQQQWIRTQPWYKGTYIPSKNGSYWLPGFPVGGWWAAKTPVLRALDFPWRSLHHRGGDYMFGEALRQNGYTLSNWHENVAVNADALGQDHQAKRRGLDPPPVGTDYQPSISTLLHLATTEVPLELLDYPGL